MVKYLLFASSSGSLIAVKYFIGKGKKPQIRYIKLLSTELDSVARFCSCIYHMVTKFIVMF